MIQKRDYAAIREDNLRHDLDYNNTTAAGRRVPKTTTKKSISCSWIKNYKKKCIHTN